MRSVVVGSVYQADRRLFDRYIRYIPVLWLLGVLTPAAIGLLLYLSKRYWPKGLLINSVVIAWLSIGGMQMISSIINGLLIDDFSEGLHYSVSMVVYGWMFAGLAIGVGYSCRLANYHFVRAITILGASIIVFGGIAGWFRMSGSEALILETPISMLFPNSSTVQAYARAVFYALEDNWGDNDTRLTLFFPWSTALGLSGVAVVWISLLDRSFLFRLIGVAGGLIANLFSLSRSAIAIMGVTIAIYLFLRLGGLTRSLICLVGLLLAFGIVLNGFDPISAIGQAQENVDDIRPGSSMVRALVYEGSWNGFWESPIIGHGWPGESVLKDIKLQVGTHSSISGVLYTGGIITFGAFLIAVALTFFASLQSTFRPDYRSESRRFAEVGLLLTVAIVSYCPIESLFAITLPNVFLFAWIGGAIREGGCYRIESTMKRQHSAVVLNRC
jgi:hypothetical protein